MSTALLTDVHVGLQNNSYSHNCYLVKGSYEYYHYLCDAFNDRHWGCGYRTLQTMCSWLSKNYDSSKQVPTIKEIQEMLVDMEDKPSSFVGSRQWIGSFEVCLVIDKLFDVPCKIIHINKGDHLEDIVEQLKNHFEKFGSPIMMGGNIDCSSKGIMGIHVNGSQSCLLVVDPHYVGKERSKQFLQEEGWVKWQSLQEFIGTSFYNFCLPQVKAK